MNSGNRNSGGCGSCLLSILVVAGGIVLVALFATITHSDIDEWGSTKTTLAVAGAVAFLIFCVQLFRN